MAQVSPLTPEQITQVRQFLRKNYYSETVVDIIDAGFQLPLRISDLRKIKFSDIKNGNTLHFKAKKTGKSQALSLNSKFMEIVEKRKQYGDEYVFQSHSNRAKRSQEPISSSMVYKAMDAAGEVLKVNVGTHTLRKSWARNAYDKGVPVEVITFALQHSSVKQTLVYIGINQDTLNNLTSSFEL